MKKNDASRKALRIIGSILVAPAPNMKSPRTSWARKPVM